MKKTVAVLLALVLAFSMTVYSGAAVTVDLVLGAAEFTEVGEVKTIPITVENLESVSVIQVVIEYDSTKMKLLNVASENTDDYSKGQVIGAEGNFLSDVTISSPKLGEIIIVWDDEYPISGSGVIANLTFEALEVGKEGLTLSDDPNNELILRGDGEGRIPDKENTYIDVSEEINPVCKAVVSGMEGKPEESVTASVLLKNNPGIDELEFKVDYDKTKLEFIGVEDSQITSWTVDGDIVKWAGNADTEVTGEVLKLKFNILETAEAGKTPIELTNITASNAEGTDVEFTAITGGITIKSYTPGDVDEDGSVTSYDASLILQYVVGNIEADDIVIDAADVDGDSIVTSYDASLILQYVVGNITVFPVG